MKNTVGDAPTFAGWIQCGGFNLRTASTTDITIECAPVEIASVFLRDVERLLNHCVEQALEIYRFGVENCIRSDAWNVVTIYYHCFFAAQALLRLIGEPVFFMDKENIGIFKSIAAAANFPGPGMFEFHQTSVTTLSLSEYTFKKKSRRPHEATWKKLLHLFDSFVHDRALATDAKEASLFASLATQKLFRIYSDYDWPSRVRYNANYNPGFAYLLVEGRNRARTKKLFQRWKGIAEPNLEAFLRSTVDDCICSNDFDAFETQVRLLFDVGQVLFIISKRLYHELLLRRNCDKRWSLHRYRLVERAGISPDEYSLLYSR
ncbi:MAG TPA: hypothetical protein VMF08_15420 [Candidatus Sulfotelmatobacter sp.]|nr:hypothetical protein [Candidatus Sulfotelmatobacter sp.]